MFYGKVNTMDIGIIFSALEQIHSAGVINFMDTIGLHKRMVEFKTLNEMEEKDENNEKKMAELMSIFVNLIVLHHRVFKIDVVNKLFEDFEKIGVKFKPPGSEESS